jgi:excinuclease ABC subunit A
VAAGTPEHVASVKESYTGRYLKDLLMRRAGGAQQRSAGGAQEKSSKASGSKKQAAE